MRAIWALSFDEDNRKVMVQDEKLEVFPALEKLKDSHITIISKAAYGILWNLREFLQNSKLERFRNIGMYCIKIGLSMQFPLKKTTALTSLRIVINPKLHMSLFVRYHDHSLIPIVPV